MVLRDSQATFGGGELSPALWGRTDLQKYKTGLRVARNINILPQGGTRNRPGTGYVAQAGDSTNAVRLIPFIASTTAAYMIELGNFYARFYTLDAQVQASGVADWITGTSYIPGNFVVNAGITYYCLVAHTSGTFATDLANGDWRAQTAYQIVTPYSAEDIFQIKFAQSADVLYLAHPEYAPETLTFLSGSSWLLALYNFKNGPFMPQNVSQSQTMAASAISNTAATKIISKVISYSIGGQQYRVELTTSTAHGLVNGTPVAISLLDGLLATDLNGNTFTAVVVNSTQLKLFYSGTTNPVKYSGSASGDFDDYTPGAGQIAFGGAVTLAANFPIFDPNHVGALFEITETLSAQTITDTGFTSDTHSSASILCGQDWSIITLGGWTGKILIQISTDQGVTWRTVQTLQGQSQNFQTSGETGVSQCYLRVSADSTVTWSGTATINLTASSFDWNGIVQVTAYISSTSVSITITNPEGLSSTNSTYQWSEGSWSILRGWPTCVTFYQDRSTWASTISEPNTVWHSKTASYNDFGVSFPLIDSDGFSVVLSSRQLNSVNSLVPMPQALIVLSGDMAFGLSPGNNGAYAPTSVQQTPMDHRGSYNVDPVIVGNEIILIQQMGTVVRNFIFQLAVNGFMGDNVSVASQHLFTNFTIIQMAYQQEPDSIVWAVRNDGALLSCTYDRAQEMSAWTHHDTAGGLFESVACIPNTALGINEIWFVINRNGTRFIETLKKRDQGTVPADQWFVDCGTQYVGSPATVISGIPLPDGAIVSVLADGFVVSNGITDQSMVVAGGTITLATAASKVTVGIPFVWDADLLDIETPDQRGTQQGLRMKQPRAKLRCWNSRGGYISTTDPVDSTSISGFDALADLMLRDPSVNMDTPLPLVTGITDQTLPSGYQYGSHICIRGIDPLPFTLLDVISEVVRGGN